MDKVSFQKLIKENAEDIAIAEAVYSQLKTQLDEVYSSLKYSLWPKRASLLGDYKLEFKVDYEEDILAKPIEDSLAESSVEEFITKETRQDKLNQIQLDMCRE